LTFTETQNTNKAKPKIVRIPLYASTCN